MKFKTLKSCFSKEMLLKCWKDFTNFDRIVCYIHNESSRKKRKTKPWELLSNNLMFLKNCWWLSFLCSSHLVGHATLVLLGRGVGWFTKWGLQQWLYLSGMTSFKKLKNKWLCGWKCENYKQHTEFSGENYLPRKQTIRKLYKSPIFHKQINSSY